MHYHRMPIEIESPEEQGYLHIRINLAESSVAELSLAELGVDLNEIKLEYTSHKGHEGLRTLIAHESNNLSAHDVLLTGGAAMALFIIHSTLLSKGDHMIVVHPNYSSNIEVPKAIGCEVTQIHLDFEHQWQLDMLDLEQAIQPNTKLISLTSPHNPTGQLLKEEHFDRLKLLLEKHNLHVLVDETYRDACFTTPYPLVASMHPKCISVFSFSKGYGLPGIRMGGLIIRDQELYTRFLAAKEMIQICNPPIEAAIAFQFYKYKITHLAKINAHAQRNLALFQEWLKVESRVEAILPEGGVVCFVRIKVELSDYTTFYQILFNEYGTLVGPGHWFDLSDRYMRIGFAYIEGSVLTEGLENITKTLDKSI